MASRNANAKALASSPFQALALKPSSGAPATRQKLAKKLTGQALRGFDPQFGATSGSIVQALSDVLALQMSRVVDLFREWDDDGDGLVTLDEFRRALPALGLLIDRADAEELFHSFDSDLSGEISYEELRGKLHDAMLYSRGIDIDQVLKPGAFGTIMQDARNQIALRGGELREGAGILGSMQLLTGEDAAPLAEQIRDAVAKNLARIIDLFRQWDESGDGLITANEFRHALRALGLRAERPIIDALFNVFDEDGSGAISYEELYAKLRHETGTAHGIELDAALKPGAVGDISVKAKNKMALRSGVRTNSTSGVLGSHVELMNGESAPSIAHQIRHVLAKNMARVIDLFHEWDSDGSGMISMAEFSRVLPMIGLADISEEDAKALFGSFDCDASGAIDYGELSRQLRPQAVVLPSVRSAPQLGGTSQQGSPSREGGIAELKAALEAEHAAKKQMARIQRELLRVKSTSAILAQQEAKRAAHAASKVEIDRLIGRDVAAKLAAVAPASDEEVQALAERFHRALRQIFPGPAEARAWYKLFSYMDEDRSGRITYDELQKMVRSRLELGNDVMPATKLRRLWRALDEDSSGFLDAGEFGRFMKRGLDHQEGRGAVAVARQKLIAKNMEAAAAQKTEKERRWGHVLTAQLADVAPASEAEVAVLAEQLLEKTSQLFPFTERAWFKLFRVVDADHSGRISFDEYTHMIRAHLGLKKTELSDERLGALWKSIDVDNSGLLSVAEFGCMMKKGEKTNKSDSEADAYKRRLRRQADEADEVAHMDRLRQTRATIDHAKELELEAARLAEELARARKARASLVEAKEAAAMMPTATDAGAPNLVPFASQAGGATRSLPLIPRARQQQPPERTIVRLPPVCFMARSIVEAPRRTKSKGRSRRK